MTLTDILYGSWMPPDVPGRLISTDDALVAKHIRRVHQAHGRRGGAKRAIDMANANAERIKVHVMSHPDCTAQEIGDALGLSKTPVYNYLGRFKNDKKVEIGRRQVGSYSIVCYRWIEKV